MSDRRGQPRANWPPPRGNWRAVLAWSCLGVVVLLVATYAYVATYVN